MEREREREEAAPPGLGKGCREGEGDCREGKESDSY